MSAPDATPRPRGKEQSKDRSELDGEPLFDPGDDSDLGIDEAASEDVGLDARAGLDDLAPEQWVDDSDTEDVRWTDDNEAAGDAIGEEADDADDGQSEYGWTEGNDPPTELDEDGDGLQELPPSAGDDGGEEGIADEDALIDRDFGKFEPLSADPEDASNRDAEVMSEFAAMAGSAALRDDEGVTVADGVEWGRHSLGVVRVEEPMAAGDRDTRGGVAGGTLWLDTGGLHVAQDGALVPVAWDGLPTTVRAIALPLGADLRADGEKLALVDDGTGALHGPDGQGGQGGYGPLPPLPPSVEHDGRPLACTVAEPRTRRLAAWPGHGLHVGEEGGGWRPKPVCAGVTLLASDGVRSVAALTERGLQRSDDGGDELGEPVDLTAEHPGVASSADGLWACRGFSIIRSAEGLLAHGPHGFTRLIDLRPSAVAVVWETSLPVVYCHVPRAGGGGVLARIEVRRTRTPARVVLETSEAGPGVVLGARSLPDGTHLQLWVAGQLWSVHLSAGVDGAP